MEIVAVEIEQSLIVDYRGKIVKLRVFSMYNGQIKFGIEAPPGVAVNREEIYEIFQAQKKARELLDLQ